MLKLFFARLHAFLNPSAWDRDFARELETHRQLLIEDSLRAGMTAHEAQRAARLRLGATESLRAQHRDRRGMPTLEWLSQDLRMAVRVARKERWMSAAAVITLALGIAANATGFTIVHAAFLRGLPFAAADRLHELEWLTAGGRTSVSPFADFAQWRTTATTIDLAGYAESHVNLSDPHALPEQVRGVWVTGELFDVLQQPVHLGRSFAAGEENERGPLALVISHALWSSRYRSEPQSLGATVRVNGADAAIVGVMPEGMRFPDNSDLWILRRTGEVHSEASASDLMVFGRLRPSASRAQAEAELTALVQQTLRRDRNGPAVTAVRVVPLTVGGSARTMFAVVMVAVGFFLLIACANVANLLLSRALHRSREMTLRLALGATRGRIARQLLMESLLLAAVGGALGFVLTIVSVDAFERAMQVSDKPYWLIFRVDAVVFAYVAALSLLTTALVGLLPALHLSQVATHDALKETSRTTTESRRSRWLSRGMIAGQLALTMTLLAGAGYLTHSFFTLASVDVGVSPERLLTMQITLPERQYSTPSTRWMLFERLASRVRSIAGVEAVAWTTGVPPRDGGERFVETENDVADAIALRSVATVMISPEFFAVVERPVVRGRDFDASDGAPGAATVIVNEELAAQFFPGEEAIGRRLRFTDVSESSQTARPEWHTIVGVSAPIRHGHPLEAYRDAVAYLPHREGTPPVAWLLLRAGIDRDALIGLVRREVHAEAPDQPVPAVQSVAQLLDKDSWPYRIFGALFAFLAITSLVMSSVGIYAAIAYSVTRRTQEIGLRVAVGASRPQVVWLVSRGALTHLALGLPCGLAGAYALGTALESLLVEMAAVAPAMLLAVSFLLTSVVAAASAASIIRALRIDPAEALRSE